MASLRRPYQVVFLFMLCLAVNGAYAWPLVESGDNGPNVVAVQDLLQARGHSLTSDGIFGPITEDAVKAFQLANSLTADGIVGPWTWPMLIVTVQSGSSGTPVHAVQYQLANKYNLLTAADIDSSFGPITSTAVISFQASHGLAQDGIVGPLTWDALVSGPVSTTVPPSSTDSPSPCSSWPKSRDAVVNAARAAVEQKITYTQKFLPTEHRWSGIINKVCPPLAPPFADCSSFVSWAIWTAYGNGPDFLNRANWNGGATSTMRKTGQEVGNHTTIGAARDGDVVIYFNANGTDMHATLYNGQNQYGIHEVISFGALPSDKNLPQVAHPPSILPIDYCKTYYPTWSIHAYTEMN